MTARTVLLRTALALLFFAFSGVLGISKISCKNEYDQPVDWFIFYKLPIRYKDGVESGLEYMYLDSTKRSLRKGSHLINSNKSALGRTLRPLYETFIFPSNDTAYLLYNDAVPENMNHSRKYGHTKGLLVWDRVQGFWLIHSIPGFPPVPEGVYGYPSSGIRFGQSGICITFEYSQYGAIDSQLLVSQPNIYSCFIPDFFHRELIYMTQLCAKSSSLMAPGRRLAILQSAQGLHFFHFAKSSSYTEDIFTAWMAPELKAHLLAQTWRRRNSELSSNCSLPYHVHNVNIIKMTQDHYFSSFYDHSKWCISTKASKSSWTCIGDLNRSPNQAFRGGGFICTKNGYIYQSFLRLIFDYEHCD